MPILARLLIALGALLLACGAALAAGAARDWHPLLAAPGAGLVLIVSAIALIGSGLFPLVLARLAARDALCGSPPDDGLQ